MAERRDQYFLNASNPFDVSDGLEQREDVTLSPDTTSNQNVIVGSAVTGTTALANALIKVLDHAGNPLTHTFTNSGGAFATVPLPAATYQVEASVPGFLLGGPITVQITGGAGAPPRADFNLTVDPRAALSALFGLTYNAQSNTRLAGAAVVLSLPDGTAVSTTLSNGDGQYLISQVPGGSYVLAASKTGYSPSPPVSVTVATAQIARNDLFLPPALPVGATVNGFIRDTSGGPLAGACVGLYALSGTSETLLRTVLSNADGLYLFGRVDPGRYLVKAKRESAV